MPGSFRTTQPRRNVQRNVKGLCTAACEGIDDWGGELLWIYVSCPVLSLDSRENNFNFLSPFTIVNGDQYLTICYCAWLHFRSLYGCRYVQGDIEKSHNLVIFCVFTYVLAPLSKTSKKSVCKSVLCAYKTTRHLTRDWGGGAIPPSFFARYFPKLQTNYCQIFKTLQAINLAHPDKRKTR